MRFDVLVAPALADKEFAVVTLRPDDGSDDARLSIDYTPIRRRCRGPKLLALDFLLIASCVYAVDKLVSRASSPDCWTRQLTLSIPVSDPHAWARVSQRLADAVSFLTGDFWSFEFTSLRNGLARPKRGRVRRFPPLRGEAVSLFSGGLDSLVGVIDWLEQNPVGRLVMVGHHDPKIAGPNGDQARVYASLLPYYRARMDILQVGVGHEPKGEDTNYRSRSILFIALGVLVASSLPGDVPLLIPENGTISLNVPLTPSRRGSCSTRTTHPFFMGTLESILRDVGVPVRLVNPLLGKTKGECVSDCLGPSVIAIAAKESRSCAKRGHTSHWVRSRDSSIDQCGRCVPCIFRRAAMHASGLDDEVYGNDICAGEVDVDADGDLANDLRAVLAFLAKNYSRDEIAAMLVSNGPIDVSAVSVHADTVFRAIEEVRHLIRDKATDEICHAAGVAPAQ